MSTENTAAAKELSPLEHLGTQIDNINSRLSRCVEQLHSKIEDLTGGQTPRPSASVDEQPPGKLGGLSLQLSGTEHNIDQIENMIGELYELL